MDKLKQLIGKKVQIIETGHVNRDIEFQGVLDDIREQLIRVVNCIQQDSYGRFSIEAGTIWFNMAAQTFRSLKELEEK